MPYLYSMAGWVHFDDYTMMRPLVMDFTDDHKVYNIKDQWMFGPALMACPVGYYKARTRSVYFPDGGWYDLYTGEKVIEGCNIDSTSSRRLIVDAPYERIPVFVREGSIIPFGPALEWSDERPAELICLYVYGGRDAQFTLYEDEGDNYNYEKGKYATIDITYDDNAKTLILGQCQGSFPGMLQQRHFQIVYVNKDAARPLDFDSSGGEVVEYTGKRIQIKLKN